VNEKVEKLRQKGEEIRRKRQKETDCLEEFLNQQNKNVAELVDDNDEEIARVLSFRKKHRKEVDLLLCSEKERYEHELLAENLTKYLKDTERKIWEWRDHQEAKAATEIMEIDLDTEKYMKDFEKKIHKLQTEIQAKHKDLFAKISKNQISEENLPSEIMQKSFRDPEVNYLCQAFEEYGIAACDSDEFDHVLLIQSPLKPILKNVYPKHFDCQLKKLQLNCFNRPNFNLEIVCSLLENISQLSKLRISFEEKPSLEFELLMNLLSRLHSLESFFLSFPAKEISVFLKFINNLLSLNKVSDIGIRVYDGDDDDGDYVNLGVGMKPTKPSLNIFSMSIMGGFNSIIFSKDIETLFNLIKSTALEHLILRFFPSVDPQILKYLDHLIESLPNLKSLDLQINNPSVLKDQTLNRKILERIIQHEQLRYLRFLASGDYCSASPEIAKILGSFQQTLFSSNKLKRIELLLVEFEKFNILELLKFLGCFPQLKALTIRMQVIGIGSSIIDEFFKGIHQLKSLKEFYFDFIRDSEPSPSRLLELKALLPPSLMKSEVEFQDSLHLWSLENLIGNHDEEEEED